MWVSQENWLKVKFVLYVFSLTYTQESALHQSDVSEIFSHHYESSPAASEDSSLEKKQKNIVESVFISR